MNIPILHCLCLSLAQHAMRLMIEFSSVDYMMRRKKQSRNKDKSIDIPYSTAVLLSNSKHWTLFRILYYETIVYYDIATGLEMALSSEESFSNGDSCNLFELTLDEIIRRTTTIDENVNDDYSVSPIQLCCITCLFFTVLVFAVSELSRNYSQTDKL